MSVELGPGLISTIYDGIQRPLEKLYEVSGTNIHKGVEAASLDSILASLMPSAITNGPDTFTIVPVFICLFTYNQL